MMVVGGWWWGGLKFELILIHISLKLVSTGSIAKKPGLVQSDNGLVMNINVKMI